MEFMIVKKKFRQKQLFLLLLVLLIAIFSFELSGCVKQKVKTKVKTSIKNLSKSKQTIKYYKLINPNGVYNGSALPLSIAIDAKGNVWVPSIEGIQELVKSDSSEYIIKSNPAINSYVGTMGFIILNNIAIGKNGNLYVNRAFLTKYNHSLTLLNIFNNSSSSPFAIDANGNIWDAVAGNEELYEFNKNGTKKNMVFYNNNGYVTYSIAIDANRNIWLTNANGTINIVNPSKLSKSVTINYKSETGNIPYDIAIGKNGNVWVTNFDVGTITKLNSSGKVINTYPLGKDATNAGSIAIDAKGNIWVTYKNLLNSHGIVVELKSKNGKIMKNYILTKHFDPNAIAIDKNGNIWVAGVSIGEIAEIKSATNGKQYFPYSGPQYP
jgi:streptogramin lyase